MNSIPCPKCGRDSENEEICDSCGALISRITQREREMETQRQLDSFDAPTAVQHYPRGSTSGRLTKFAVLVGLMAIAFFFARGGFQKKVESSIYVHEYDSSSFTTAVINDKPENTWVVDFWAPWCGPCRQFAPEFAATAETVSPRASFAKVNVDEASDLAQRYGIRGIPAVLLFRGGRLIAQTGGLPRDQLQQWVESNL